MATGSMVTPQHNSSPFVPPECSSGLGLDRTPNQRRSRSVMNKTPRPRSSLTSINFMIFHSTLPNNKIQQMSKLKAFEGDKLNAPVLIEFAFENGENIVGKGENAGFQYFLFFQQYILKMSFHRGVKTLDCVVKS